MNNEKELRHRYGWTPAATKPMYSQTNVNLEHKGRDYDAILRAAKRDPVGYWEDAPRGIKFGGERVTPAKPEVQGDAGRVTYRALEQTPASAPAPTTPPPQQSADDLYEPVGTLPVVGDTVVQTDKRIGPQINHTLIEAYGKGSFKDERGLAWGPGAGWDTVRVLKRKPPAQAAAARAWRSGGCVYANLSGAKVMIGCRGVWSKSICNTSDLDEAVRRHPKGYTELHGPERDAIVAECREAMGL